MQEVAALEALPEEERYVAFYHVWSRKEALIKALGEGLFAPLNEFSVSPTEKIENVSMTHAGKKFDYFVESFTAHPDYQSAFATTQRVDNISYWQWLDGKPVAW